MTDCCKACGRDATVTPRTPDLLGWVHLSDWPDWLDGICTNCIFALRNYSESMGEDLAPITIQSLNLYLADMLCEVSSRISAQKPALFCQVLEDDCLVGMPPCQCSRFAADAHGGRHVCWVHRNRIRRGAEVAFVHDDKRPPKPFLIWAKSGSQLIERATEIASAMEGA